MRISHKYKFIFFCSPKTGSESVRKMLDPYSDVTSTVFRNISNQNPFYSHMTPFEAKHIFDQRGWDFNSYTKFVFVRNPWSRLASLYDMIVKNSGGAPNTATFSQWLSTIKPYGLGGGGDDWKRWRKYGTYTINNYVADDAGRRLIDKVIKLENIDTDLMPFLKHLRLPDVDNKRVQHINTTLKKKHYTDYYTKQTEQFVAEMYADDIKEFGYSFDDAIQK